MNPDPVTYSASDLTQGGPVFKALAPPAKLAVFGDPVAHSKSPAFQNAALHACGIDASCVRIHVAPEQLESALRALPSAGFLGANLTIPHKAAAIPFMDEIDESARRMGAVNTVAIDGTRLVGFNTDGPGLVRAIREEFLVDIRDLRIMVLGAGGGAGRAIAVQCALERCARLVLVNRTVEKARALARELSPMFRSDRLAGPSELVEAVPLDAAAIAPQIDQVDLVINATSVGMKRTDPPLLPQSLLTPNLLVYDTIYVGGQTRLMQDAEAAGARAANGLSMLLHQGALAFEIWFNRPAPVDIMRSALRDAV